MVKDLLLVSTGKSRGHEGFLGYCQAAVKELFGNATEVLLINYANPSYMDQLIAKDRAFAHTESMEVPTPVEREQRYTEFMRPTFQQMGFKLSGIEEHEKPYEAIGNAQAVYLAGGNTYDLHEGLHSRQVLDILQTRLNEGLTGLCVSAGTVLVGQSIYTSNDNAKTTFGIGTGLQLVPFSIKPHFRVPIPVSEAERTQIRQIRPDLVDLVDYQGESHIDRVMEFHHDHAEPVVGLPEGSMLRVRGDSIQVGGVRPARIMLRNRLMANYEPAIHVTPGESIDLFLRDHVF